MVDSCSIVSLPAPRGGGTTAGDLDWGQAVELHVIYTFGSKGGLATSIPHSQYLPRAWVVDPITVEFRVKKKRKSTETDRCTPPPCGKLSTR